MNQNNTQTYCFGIIRKKNKDKNKDKEINNKITELTDIIKNLKAKVIELDIALQLELEKHFCVICLNAQREFAIHPCMHLCVCGDCKTRLKQCPLCRKTVKKIVKIYN